MPRIHIMGASGCGTTTLGRALAEAIGAAHLDTDDFYWMPTDPPYAMPRAARERNDLIAEATNRAAQHWVLSGSALKWNAGLETKYDLVIFLRLDPDIRMDRIRTREKSRYGERTLAGGDMFEKSQAFLAWAASYDTAGPEHRSLVAHHAWLANLACPVLHLDSAATVEGLVASVLDHPVAGQRKR